MQPDIETELFAVFDDVLNENDWAGLWEYINHEQLISTPVSAGAWNVGEPAALLGPDVHTPNRDQSPLPDGLASYPSQTALDALLNLLLERSETWTPWVSATWQRITARAYVYPRGSSLGWHCDDHALYTGAFVYYTHPYWNCDWGGELMVASIDEDTQLPTRPGRFDNHDYDQALMDHALGHYIQPRPNRLVILGGAPHRIAAITAAAGQHVRASVAGFFLREALEA